MTEGCLKYSKYGSYKCLSSSYGSGRMIKGLLDQLHTEMFDS